MEETQKPIKETIEVDKIELTLVVEPSFVRDLNKMMDRHNMLFGTEITKLSEYLPIFVYGSINDYYQLKGELTKLKSESETKGMYG